MPKEVFGRDYQFLERSELLTFEEWERLAVFGDAARNVIDRVAAEFRALR
jgi:hypothetical protein